MYVVYTLSIAYIYIYTQCILYIHCTLYIHYTTCYFTLISLTHTRLHIIDLYKADEQLVTSIITCTLCIAQHTLYTVQCTMYVLLYCTLYTVQCIMV